MGNKSCIIDSESISDVLISLIISSASASPDSDQSVIDDKLKRLNFILNFRTNDLSTRASPLSFTGAGSFRFARQSSSCTMYFPFVTCSVFAKVLERQQS